MEPELSNVSSDAHPNPNSPIRVADCGGFEGWGLKLQPTAAHVSSARGVSTVETCDDGAAQGGKQDGGGVSV